MENYSNNTIKKYITSYQGIPLICWKGILFSLIESTIGGVCFFLSFYLVNILHLPIYKDGFIISSYGLGNIIGGLIGGKLSDNISPFITMCLSLIFQIICYFMLAQILTFNLLLVNLLTLGVATYSFITSNNAWTLQYCSDIEKEKLQAINLLYVSSNLGISLSALLIIIFSPDGFKYIFISSSFALMISLCYLILGKNKEKPKNADCLNPIEMGKISQNKKNSSLKLLILLCVFGVGLIISTRMSTYLVYIYDSFPEFGIRGMSVLFAINPIIIVLFQSSLINVFRGFHKLTIIGLGCFFMGIGMMLLNLSSMFYMAIVACIVYTCGEILFFSMAQLVFYEEGENNRKGEALGIFKSVYAISMILGPSLGGLIYHNLGGSTVWYLSGVIGIFCFTICCFYRQMIIHY